MRAVVARGARRDGKKAHMGRENSMTEAEMRRHEWQCRQGRGDVYSEDELNAARGIVWTFLVCLIAWCAAITWALL
jgi:hypothetical protein